MPQQLTICLAFGFVLGAQSKPSKTGGKLKSKKPAQTAPAANTGPAGQTAPVAEEKPISGGPRRDPFLPLVSERKEGGPIEHLPPGKNGLVINTVQSGRHGALRKAE